jgi:hypothetical protein
MTLEQVHAEEFESCRLSRYGFDNRLCPANMRIIVVRHCLILVYLTIALPNVYIFFIDYYKSLTTPNKLHKAEISFQYPATAIGFGLPPQCRLQSQVSVLQSMAVPKDHY